MRLTSSRKFFEDAEYEPTPYKAWSPLAIAVICYCFSFLPAGILYALNWKRLGKPERVKTSLYITGATFIFFALNLFSLNLYVVDTREMFAVYNFYNLFSAVYFFKDQQSLYKRHREHQGKKSSSILAFLLGIVLMTPWFVLAIPYTYVEEAVVQKRHEQGLRLIEQEKYKEAESIFLFHCRKYPEDTTARWNLAVIYQNTGRITAAIQQMNRFLQLEPQNKEAWEYLRELEALR